MPAVAAHLAAAGWMHRPCLGSFDAVAGLVRLQGVSL